ncbi:hypothetical protein CURTO8I2_60111 [Curtobacterium sp. 8I-2]|nr:hypothetical protein CURTO8I2_60111 [Curtobacterium sp. 8I-2]
MRLPTSLAAVEAGTIERNSQLDAPMRDAPHRSWRHPHVGIVSQFDGPRLQLPHLRSLASVNVPIKHLMPSEGALDGIRSEVNDDRTEGPHSRTLGTRVGGMLPRRLRGCPLP